MRIGELAARLGVSARTLVRFEARGLIPAARRDWNGHRRYVEADVDVITDVVFAEVGRRRVPSDRPG